MYETLGVRLEIRKRHSLGVSRCENTPCLAWCCDRHLTQEALGAAEAGHILHSLKHETTQIQCVAASVSRNVKAMCQTVVSEHSPEAIQLDTIAVIVIKVKNRQAVLDHCGKLLTVWKTSANS